jgi:hypothetical protein
MDMKMEFVMFWIVALCNVVAGSHNHADSIFKVPP